MVMTFEEGWKLMAALDEKELAKTLNESASKMRKHVPRVNGSKQAAALLALAGLRDAGEVNQEVLKAGGSKNV